MIHKNSNLFVNKSMFYLKASNLLVQSLSSINQNTSPIQRFTQQKNCKDIERVVYDLCFGYLVNSFFIKKKIFQ